MATKIVSNTNKIKTESAPSVSNKRERKRRAKHRHHQLSASVYQLSADSSSVNLKTLTLNSVRHDQEADQKRDKTRISDSPEEPTPRLVRSNTFDLICPRLNKTRNVKIQPEEKEEAKAKIKKNLNEHRAENEWETRTEPIMNKSIANKKLENGSRKMPSKIPVLKKQPVVSLTESYIGPVKKRTTRPRTSASSRMTQSLYESPDMTNSFGDQGATGSLSPSGSIFQFFVDINHLPEPNQRSSIRQEETERRRPKSGLMFFDLNDFKDLSICDVKKWRWENLLNAHWWMERATIFLYECFISEKNESSCSGGTLELHNAKRCPFVKND